MLTRIREGKTGNPQFGLVLKTEERATSCPSAMRQIYGKLDGGVGIVDRHNVECEAHESAVVDLREDLAAIAILLQHVIQGERNAVTAGRTR